MSGPGRRSLYTIYAIAFQQDDLWVARCLEVDLVGFTRQGLRELVEDLADQLQAAAVLVAAAGRPLFEGYRKAPPRWWNELSRVEGEPWRPAAPRQHVDLRVYPIGRTSSLAEKAATEAQA
jgi:hypothetical protein